MSAFEHKQQPAVVAQAERAVAVRLPALPHRERDVHGADWLGHVERDRRAVVVGRLKAEVERRAVVVRQAEALVRARAGEQRQLVGVFAERSQRREAPREAPPRLARLRLVDDHVAAIKAGADGRQQIVGARDDVRRDDDGDRRAAQSSSCARRLTRAASGAAFAATLSDARPTTSVAPCRCGSVSCTDTLVFSSG